MLERVTLFLIALVAKLYERFAEDSGKATDAPQDRHLLRRAGERIRRLLPSRGPRP